MGDRRERWASEEAQAGRSVPYLCCDRASMVQKRALRKVVDDEIDVRCASGPGLIREEVWEDAQGVVVRHNLAFINHFMTSADHGRALG